MVLVAYSLAAGCTPHPPVMSAPPAPATGAQPQSGAPVSAAASASDPAGTPAIDTPWSPWVGNIRVGLVDRHGGNAGRPGPFRYTFLYPPGASFGARRNNIDVRITVRQGTEFILMGNLESARVQRFDAGSTFVIPAGTWYVEWFETDTLVDVEGVGPRAASFASPETPRVP